MRLADCRRPRLRLPLALLAAPAAAAALAAGAYAIEARITELQVPSQSLAFPVTSMSFEASTLSFSEGQLFFPGSIMQMQKSDAVEVDLPADVLFDFDKAELRPEARETLHEVAGLLMERPRRSIAITGHTDAIGQDAYNQRLSERRAQAVKTWLVAKEGIKSPPISTAGRGARDPVAPNKRSDGSDNPEGRQLNRRVTIVFR